MSEKIKNFYELDAWKKAHEFILKIYNMTKKFPKEELYGITSQFRRAASSITANIAEGFSRYHYNDKIRFYHNARGSLSEIQSFLFLAKDLFFLKEEAFRALFDLSEEVNKLINGLIRSIESQKQNY
jgi:four helix bundle protein